MKQLFHGKVKWKRLLRSGDLLLRVDSAACVLEACLVFQQARFIYYCFLTRPFSDKYR